MTHAMQTSASAVAAIGVTLGLFFMMNQLISHQFEVPVDTPPDKLPTITQKEPSRTEHKTERVPEPVDVQTMPKTVLPSTINIGEVTHTTGVTVKLDPVTDVDVSAANLDGMPLAQVKVQPVYPPRAASKGLEGHCTVSFTVLASGAVTDVKVLESDCTSKLFHKASINAAKKFKYHPRRVDGQAMSTPGMYNRFTYRLSD